MRRTILLVLLLATAALAENPTIIKVTIDSSSFSIVSKIVRYDTAASDISIDTVTSITWRGAVTFSARDAESDSMGVFIDIVAGTDTIAADSIWGATRIASGNDHIAHFTFRTVHRSWSGAVTIKLRLSLDDVFIGFSGRPRIIAQPMNVSTLAGFSAQFSVTATGDPAPNYQWAFNGTVIAGANAPEYKIPMIDSGQAGVYSVIVSNGNGSVTSAPATLAVSYAPWFTLQPLADTVDTGKSVSFTVAASGRPAPTCQWRKDGVDIPGATSTTFTISSVRIGDSGIYTAVLSNLVGNMTSAPAVLTVNYAPRIVAQPKPATARPGQSALFQVFAVSRPPPSFQWRKNGTPISGEQYSSFAIMTARPDDTGNYDVVITNAMGSVTSSAAAFVYSPARLTTDSLIALDGGTFFMGKTFLSDPVHQVTLTPFKMSNTLVTQVEYTRVTGVNPSILKGDSTRPVENVTWYDAVLYCNRKSVLEGRDSVYRYTAVIGTPYNGCTGLDGLVIDKSVNGYRLPTEAEYEYACRAGTSSDFYWGGTYPPRTHEDTAAIDCNAVWFHNSGATSQPVGMKQPNPWGLYDIAGQTWHWLNDWYGAYPAEAQTDPDGPATGFSRTVRGGSWSVLDDDQHLRSMARNGGYFPNDRSSIIGFRVVAR